MPIYNVKNKKTEEVKEIFCSYDEKIKWLKDHNLWFHPFIVSRKNDKQTYASKDKQLIDDAKENIDQFIEEELNQVLSGKQVYYMLDYYYDFDFFVIGAG